MPICGGLRIFFSVEIGFEAVFADLVVEQVKANTEQAEIFDEIAAL